MHYRWQTTTNHWRRTVVFLSVAFLIAWNFATIEHQLDLDPEHHSHHHCQMFAGAQHGLVKALPQPLTLTFQHTAIAELVEKPFITENVSYTARAPPAFTNC